MRFLRERKFRYYFCSIWEWESSRCQTPAILYQPYMNKTPPIFIEAEHTCSNSADRMRPCAHPCCRLWFQEVSRKCGYSHPDTQTSTSDTDDRKQMKDSQGSKDHPKKKVAEESFSTPRQRVPIKCKGKQKKSTSGSASLLHNFPMHNQPAEPQTLTNQKKEIEGLLHYLTDHEGLLKERLVQLKHHVSDQLQMWKALSPDNFLVKYRAAMRVLNSRLKFVQLVLFRGWKDKEPLNVLVTF